MEAQEFITPTNVEIFVMAGDWIKRGDFLFAFRNQYFHSVRFQGTAKKNAPLWGRPPAKCHMWL
jgi:hypothetical protein